MHKAADSTAPVPLSPRQSEIIELRARGFLYKEIADALGISVSTVKCHLKKIFVKLQARSSNEAVYKHRPKG